LEVVFKLLLGACPPRPYADWREVNAAASLGAESVEVLESAVKVETEEDVDEEDIVMEVVLRLEIGMCV
jgi:hypothetical protein